MKAKVIFDSNGGGSVCLSAESPPEEMILSLLSKNDAVMGWRDTGKFHESYNRVKTLNIDLPVPAPGKNGESKC